MSFEWDETINQDGSTTYSIKCDLAVGYDEFLNRSANPLVALGWSEEQDRYVVRQGAVEYDEEEERFLYSDDNNSDGDDATTSTAFPLKSKDVVARECWCARPFQLFAEEETNPPAYCPVDTNGDGVPFGKNDPNTCLVRAYRNPNGVLQRQGYAVDCFAEQRLMVFARSAWPLCFFWLVMLLYVWSSTNYGKRCKGFIWRMFALACFKARKYCKREKRAEAEGVAVAPTANANANANAATAADNNNDDRDEEAGTASLHLAIEDTPNTIEEEEGSSSSSEAEEDEENSMQVITRDFGSHENYRLLDCDLRYNAERTNNEYITWLWYSALHSEEQRYKRERKRLRRERRQNQRRRQREWRLRRENSQRRRDNQAEQAAEGQGEPASNDNPAVVEDDLSSLHSHENDNDNQSEAMREILVTRRLEAVYWWPPAGPDGRRWQHLIDLNNGLRQRRLRAAEAANSTISDHLETDENSEDFTYDPNRLFLRTKPFSIEECLSESAQHVYNNNNNNNNSGDTENNDETTEEPNTNTNTSDVEEIPENLCSICLCEIEDGEIVGDLSCKHYFHKDCLKVWLVKSNLCPFCRRCNIASHKTKTTNLTRYRRLTASTLAAGDTEDATV
jgi:hypothetical protein